MIVGLVFISVVMVAVIGIPLFISWRKNWAPYEEQGNKGGN